QLVESESGFTRKNLARDRASRVVALLHHVFWKLLRLRIAITRQQKRSRVAVLHPARFGISELRQLSHRVITLPFSRGIAAVDRLGPVETRVAFRHGAVVE